MGTENEGTKIDSNGWLEPKEQAEYLGISISQVYWFMKQNPPPYPFYRVTATKRLSKRADLDAWLEKVKVSSEASKKSKGGLN